MLLYVHYELPPNPVLNLTAFVLLHGGCFPEDGLLDQELQVQASPSKWGSGD